MSLDVAVRLVLDGLAKSTLTAYKTGQRHFLRFAAEENMSIHEVLPATPTVVLAFVTYLFLRPTTLAYKSIKAYICHVKALAKTLAIDCAAFQCERVALALRTVRRLRGSKTRPKRLPITVALLAKFLLILRSRPRSVDISAIAAILAVGVFGLFRSGELVPKSRKDDVLLRRHILWEKDKVTVHLNGSKTDPFREGIDIVIFKNTSSPCPYSAFLEHWDMAPDKHPNAPAFQRSNGSPVSYPTLLAAIKTLAGEAGLDDSTFSGHSMRIGGATTLALLGYPAHIIKEIGRWRSLSYQLYTRMSFETHRKIVDSMSTASSKTGNGVQNYFGGMRLEQACDLSLDNIEFVWSCTK